MKLNHRYIARIRIPVHHCLPAVIAAVASACIFSGCNTSGCLENRNSVPLAGFYSDRDSSAISLDSLLITGIGAPKEAPLNTLGESISQIYLPMRSTHASTAWKLAYKWTDLDFEELCDTVIFVYDSQPYFSSAECGVIYKYHITDVNYTTHLLHGVQLTDSTITNLDVEQIKIYFKTGN